MFIVQRVEGERERGDRLGGGQQTQRVSGRGGVDDDFVVFVVPCEADHLIQPDELVDPRNRQAEQRVDVFPIEPRAVLDDVAERLLMGAQPSGKRAMRVDFRRVQRRRGFRPAHEADAPRTRREPRAEHIAERVRRIGGNRQHAASAGRGRYRPRRGARGLADAALTRKERKVRRQSF